MEYIGFLLNIFLGFLSIVIIDCLPKGQAIIQLKGLKKIIFYLIFFLSELILGYIIKLSTRSYSSYFLGIVLLAVLETIMIIDFKYLIIPDSLNVAFGVIGVIRLLLNQNNNNIWEYLLTIPFNFGLIVIFWLIELKLKKPAIGGGDLKMFICVGLLLGLKREIVVIGLSSFIMLVEIVLIKLILNKNYEGYYPYGPSICISIMIIYLWGEKILTLY